MPSHSGAAAKRQKVCVDAPEEPYYPTQILYVKLIHGGDIFDVIVPYASTTIEELAKIVNAKLMQREYNGGKKRVDKFFYRGIVANPRGENRLMLVSELGLHKESTIMLLVK